MSDKTKAILVIIIGSLISGAVSPVVKIGLIKIPPFSFSFIRFLISSIVLLPFFLKTKTKFDKDYIFLVLLSFLPTLNIALFALGIRLTTASIGQLLYGGTPLLTAIFAYQILKNKLSLQRLLSILLGLLGITIVIILPLLQKNSEFSGNISGNLLISAGVIVYSLYVVYSKKFQQKFSPLVVTSTFIFLSTLIFFCLSFSELGGGSYWWIGIKSESIYAILYSAVCGTVLSYLLGQYAIKFGGPLISSLALYLQPVFTYLTAFFLLGEKLTEGLIIGTIIIFASIGLTTYSK